MIIHPDLQEETVIEVVEYNNTQVYSICPIREQHQCTRSQEVPINFHQITNNMKISVPCVANCPRFFVLNW